jgi:protein TonB
MFDYVVETRTDEHARPRYLTTGMSMLVHFVVLALAIGLPILYASEDLPDTPTMMAFVMEAPAPPPPPPPPAPPPPAEKKPVQPVKPNQAVIQKPITAAPPNAAPVEAPKAITPETGMESAVSAPPRIEAGFETGVEGGVAGGTVGGVDVGAPPPPPPPPPPPAPKPQGPVRVGGQIKAPELTHRVNPTYPAVAQTAQVEGVVVLEATVNKEGRVSSVKVVRAHPLLQSAAIDAVKQWTYEPLRLNGEPVQFILTVTVSFSIPK